MAAIAGLLLSLPLESGIRSPAPGTRAAAFRVAASSLPAAEPTDETPRGPIGPDPFEQIWPTAHDAVEDAGPGGESQHILLEGDDAVREKEIFREDGIEDIKPLEEDDRAARPKRILAG